MIESIAYYLRLFAAVVLAGLAALMGIVTAFTGDAIVAGTAIGVVFALAAAFTWPRRPNAWRGDRPTDRQLSYAMDLGIDVPRGATKGEVSDMISAVTGR